MSSNTVPPPWQTLDFFTEDGLRAAQEYFYQTHAKHSRMIAEGRGAQGLIKTQLRRRLSKEMGEDFKMYTGKAIGEGSNTADSVGIRGELNYLLEQVYYRIAKEPFTSPIQEDLTIVKHPLGGLEVCFSMVHFYTTLLQRYATLAGNRRQVLKSVLDEELFKWIWRTLFSYLMVQPEQRTRFDDVLSSPAMAFVPPQRQRLPSPEKLMEVGKFLLGKHQVESHLRFPLCFYFVTLLRQIQYNLLTQPPKLNPDEAYRGIYGRKQGQPEENVLVAIDHLMNTAGNSMQSFDDVLKNEEQDVQNYVPPAEIDFFHQFAEFQGKQTANSLRKFIPRASKNEMDDNPGGTLMPILLLLRTMGDTAREVVLERLPGPMLNMLTNRITSAGVDVVDKPLLDAIKAGADRRRKGGETYSLQSRVKGTVPMQSVAASAEPQPGAAPQAPAAAPPAERPQHPSPLAAGQAPAAEGETAEVHIPPNLLQERVIVSWKVEGGQLLVRSISPGEIAAAAGREIPFLLPWVMFALQTGQIFHLPSNKASKVILQRIMGALLKQLPPGQTPTLSQEDRTGLLTEGKSLPPQKFLVFLLRKGLADPSRVQQPGTLGTALVGLGDKTGENLSDLLHNPNQDLFRPILRQLSTPEKIAVSVLYRIGRLQ